MDTDTENQATPAPAETAPAPAAPAAPRVPDAVLFHSSWLKGRSHRSRVHTALDRLEVIFYGSVGAGNPSPHFRQEGPANQGMFLGSKDAGPPGVGFGMTYHHEHERAGECRFTWEPGPDGCKLGFLKPENDDE